MSLNTVILQGPFFESNGRKTIVPIIVWLGFDPFRPVQNHIGSGAWNPAHCYARFGPRRWPSRLAQLLFFSFTYGGDWSLSVVMALASLRFQRNAQDYEEMRQGMTVFAGGAASFHEWQFRF